MAQFAELIERGHSVKALLEGEAREHAERALELCSELDQRPREEGAPAGLPRLSAQPSDTDVKRELGRLVEFLGRRSATAIGLASLGRAALALLAHDARGVEDACRDADQRFTLLGL